VRPAFTHKGLSFVISAILGGGFGCAVPPARITSTGRPGIGRDEATEPNSSGDGKDREAKPDKNPSSSGPDASGPSLPREPNRPGSPGPGPEAPTLPLPSPGPEKPVPSPGPTLPAPMPPGPIVPAPKPMPTPMPTPSTPPVDLGDCPGGPAIHQITKWWATTEGSMTPSSGTLVKKENGKSVARVTWNGNEWHVVPVWIGNQFEFNADLRASKSLTLSYQAPGDFYIQMRPGPHWSGPAQWGTKFSKSPDKVTTVRVPLEEASWGLIPGLERANFSFNEALSAVRGMVIVGREPGTYLFTGMLIDNFTPPCR